MYRKRYNKIFLGLVNKKPKRTYFNHLKYKTRKINNIQLVTPSCHSLTNTVNMSCTESKPRLVIGPEVHENVSDEMITDSDAIYAIDGPIIFDDRKQKSDNFRNINSLDENDKIKYCCISLLSLFYAGNFTQEGLRLIIAHLQNFVDFQLPKSFDRLINKIDSQTLSYDKVWFCDFCDKIINLKSCYQRNCHLCVQETK
jgi:hypothetical protein